MKFNENAIAAIKSGKQYTNVYCKNNNITESLSWSALSRTQKKAFNQVSASADLIDADPTLELFNSHLDDIRATLTKYSAILNHVKEDETPDSINTGTIYTLVFGARRFRAKDGELEEDLRGGFGKWLQLCLYRNSQGITVTKEAAEDNFKEACKDPAKAKKSSSKKTKKTVIDLDLARRYAHGDPEAKAQVDALLSALAAD